MDSFLNPQPKPQNYETRQKSWAVVSLLCVSLWFIAANTNPRMNLLPSPASLLLHREWACWRILQHCPLFQAWGKDLQFFAPPQVYQWVGKQRERPPLGAGLFLLPPPPASWENSTSSGGKEESSACLLQQPWLVAFLQEVGRQPIRGYLPPNWADIPEGIGASPIIARCGPGQAGTAWLVRKWCELSTGRVLGFAY